MKQTKAPVFLAFLALVAGCGSDGGTVPSIDDRDVCAPEEATARYVVTFLSTWSAETHPEAFPPGPHFSRLIGGTHDSGVVLWELGKRASNGIEVMAETGGFNPLKEEVEEATNSETSGRVLLGGGIGRSPGQVSLSFDIRRDTPLVTLVSMVAPSPDWFVGVSGLSLCDGDRWIDSLVVDLYVYDAGTDDGPSYLSPDDDANPKGTIFQMAAAPFLVDGGVPLVGTFTFVRE